VKLAGKGFLEQTHTFKQLFKFQFQQNLLIMIRFKNEITKTKQAWLEEIANAYQEAYDTIPFEYSLVKK